MHGEKKIQFQYAAFSVDLWLGSSYQNMGPDPRALLAGGGRWCSWSNRETQYIKYRYFAFTMAENMCGGRCLSAEQMSNISFAMLHVSAAQCCAGKLHIFYVHCHDNAHPWTSEMEYEGRGGYVFVFTSNVNNLSPPFLPNF